MEAGWLRGAADLVDRGEAERRAARAAALWLEELAPEARARRTSLLNAWVAAAEALRTALHAHESERGPLVDALFPAWRAPALRRHADQAVAAEAEIHRRLTSAYVVRRLAEPATAAALRPALDALEAAGKAWAAERDRPSLAGAEADEVRATLLEVAERTTDLGGRVRWVVRAALADRPELVHEVFPKHGRAVDASALAAGGESAAAETVAADSPSPPALDVEPETTPAARSSRGRRALASQAGPTPAAASAPSSDEGTSRTSASRTRRTTHAPPAPEADRLASSADPVSDRPGAPGSRTRITSRRRAVPPAADAAPSSLASRRAVPGKSPPRAKPRTPPGRGAGGKPRNARRS
ncbi:MAG: hypothetical protein EHM78_08650 [Myxococcaceae bacterium]|nr:MAG: hypothetical protein EHM78_08650 [Myxococcaceae bacterium]